MREHEHISFVLLFIFTVVINVDLYSKKYVYIVKYREKAFDTI